MLDTLLGLIKTTMRRYQRQTGNRKHRTVPRRTQSPSRDSFELSARAIERRSQEIRNKKQDKLAKHFLNVFLSS